MPDHSIDSPSKEDAAYQRVVLNLVLAAHPTQLTLDDLLRETESEDFASSDGVERAIRDLVAVGLADTNLLHPDDDPIVPTRAALRANELWGEVS